ncbi:MAG: hypothetical protein V5B44_11710 [Candidatus Accumulibacter necessarius]|jgi:hypothetical protein|uniref:hypothetical protein n=1 Tax=Candidatus Accumulibacter necessarius TaxID=2954386 RepID=UPI002FC2D6FB
MNKLAFAVSICLLAVQALAQEVFVTRGAGGPVYSDKPQPGSRSVTLPELNVSPAVPVTKAAVPAARKTPDEAGNRAAAVPGYQKFSIVFPENNGSVAANTALFEVRVALEPALQLGEGHAIMVSVNGRPVGQRFTATEFMIPPEFWGDTLPPANQRHQVDAAIVDSSGAVIKRAEPVTFYLRYIEFRHHRPVHQPQPLPIPVEKPRPPPALMEKGPAVRKSEEPQGQALPRGLGASPTPPPRQ